MTLRNRLQNTEQYFNDEHYSRELYDATVLGLSQALGRVKHKGLMDKSLFEKADLKHLREVIYKELRKVPLDERPLRVAAINDFFEEQDGNGIWSDKDKNGSPNCSYICQSSFIYDPIEIEILLLKMLQGGDKPQDYSRSREEIAVKLGMSRNSLDKYLNELRNGINLLGSDVKINELTYGSNCYDSTIHPIFLALNLSEVYVLTILLKKALGDLSSNIVADIYRQLSPYARERIDERAQENNITLLDKPLEQYECGYRAENKNLPIFFLKSGKRCKIVFDNGSTEARFGQIKLGDKGSFVFTDEQPERKDITIGPDGVGYLLLQEA